MSAMRGFTLIELMAVVVLIGLLATATAITLADEKQAATRRDVIDRLIDADQSARLSARRLGPSVLRFDLSGQRVWVVTPDAATTGPRPGHSMGLAEGFRIARLTWLDPEEAVRSGRPRPRVVHEHGRIDLPIASGGISRTYVIELVGPALAERAERGEKEQTTWLLVSGLTGQVTVEDDQTTIDNLLDALARRPDAD